MHKPLTDIIEFSLCDRKIYLSSLIDCFDDSPITWAIGKSFNSELTNSMLKQTYDIVDNIQLLFHSGRGLHYRMDS